VRIDELLSAARERLDRVEASDLDAARAAGALIVDIRPVEQRERDGGLDGAVVIDRNVLEWRLDPTSDHRIAEVAGHDQRVVIVCNEGYQSSLAAATLQDLGLARATDLVGGYQALLVGDAWRTDDDLAEARERFAARIPGYAPPAAYSLCRRDGAQLTLGHVNDIGSLDRLPAVVLASICGYVASTGTFPMTQRQVERAVRLLAPAEAATHVDHPNLWSWRRLLESSTADTEFVAWFVRDPNDAVVDADDALLRSNLTGL
jgi:rhodanese-related sulfurtransferase